MSYFDKLLNQPLPSSRDTSYAESGDDDFNFDDLFEEGGDEFEKELENAAKEFDEGDGSEPVQDIDAVADIMGMDDDEDDVIDSQLNELSRELDVNGSLPTSDGLDDDDFEDDDDDETNPASTPDGGIPQDDKPAAPLTGEDDKQADAMLAITATPLVLEDACTVEEIATFTESSECEIAIEEGFMLESDINQMLSELADATYYTEGAFASPNQKFKMTKKARYNQLFELSLQIEARAHHDPLYPKMQKVYKMEREIKKVWRKRYGALAAKRAKRYLMRLSKSKSQTLRNAAKQIRPAAA